MPTSNTQPAAADFDLHNLPAPTVVRLDDIIVNAKAYSPRADLNTAQLSNLTIIAKAGQPLDPITLVRKGRRFALVDGFHRVAAYRAAGWSAPVPARIHKADQLTTMRLAIEENGKTRLHLMPGERADWAWKIVQTEQDAKAQHAAALAAGAPATKIDKALVDVSKSAIAAMTGNSARLIATMREAWKIFDEQPCGLDDAEPMKISGRWSTDRASAFGTNRADWTDEQIATWNSQRIDQIAHRHRSLATEATRHAELTAAALRQIFGGRAKHIANLLLGETGETISATADAAT